ncbi:MAG: hypothetical protein A2603_06940 [Bdellovibrionales bacterium RIFOXYD1_FULL_55_31]|nr:MAG: hypothetical protein A2603_06940 [Bdellovibrionales bacterium RIFOXYD1_FULL_55_31]
MGERCFSSRRILLLLAFAGFTVPFHAEAGPACKTELEKLIPQLLEHPKTALNKDLVAHGSWNVRKEVRTRLRDAKHSDHGGKHTRAKTTEEAKKFSHSAAQYLPTKSNRALEQSALKSDEGKLLLKADGSFWKVYRFEDPVGYDQGELTRWIRVEYSSGVYHGHPMSIDRVRKYVPEARP